MSTELLKRNEMTMNLSHRGEVSLKKKAKQIAFHFVFLILSPSSHSLFAFGPTPQPELNFRGSLPFENLTEMAALPEENTRTYKHTTFRKMSGD